MAHHALLIQWFGNTWLTKHYTSTCLNVRRSPNVTYTMVWGQCFEGPRLTKRNVHNGLGTHGSPNRTNTLIWWPIAHQALHIQLCGDALLTKPYKYRGGGLGNGTGMLGVMAHGLPNITHTMVWELRAHQTLQIQLLTAHDVYNGLGTHGSPNIRNTIVWVSAAHKSVTCMVVWGHMAHQNTMVWWPMAHQRLHIQLFWRIAHQTLQIH